MAKTLYLTFSSTETRPTGNTEIFLLPVRWWSNSRLEKVAIDHEMIDKSIAQDIIGFRRTYSFIIDPTTWNSIINDKHSDPYGYCYSAMEDFIMAAHRWVSFDSGATYDKVLLAEDDIDLTTKRALEEGFTFKSEQLAT